MQVQLTIDSVSYNGGRGVGRFDGKVVFVPFTAPGDTILAKITADKGRFFEAELVEILTPGPTRREAPCPAFSSCGGCSLQHIDYQEQLRQKQLILQSSFRQFEKNLGAVSFQPFVPSPQEWNYRNRIQLHSDGKQWGYFERGSNSIIQIEQCHIAEERINKKLSQLSAQDFAKQKKLELALTENGHLDLRFGSLPPEHAYFSQVNTSQNHNLLAATLRILSEMKPGPLIDLYCGAGNFTLPIAEMWPEQEVTGVELSKQNIAFAKTKCENRKISVSWHNCDVAVYLRTLATLRAKTVVLDPPRLGCEKTVIDQLIRLTPEYILYVSCNPMTLARDLSLLCASGRYDLRSVQGFDMFPQTEHMEVLSVLQKRTLPDSD